MILSKKLFYSRFLVSSEMYFLRSSIFPKKRSRGIWIDFYFVVSCNRMLEYRSVNMVWWSDYNKMPWERYSLLSLDWVSIFLDIMWPIILDPFLVEGIQDSECRVLNVGVRLFSWKNLLSEYFLVLSCRSCFASVRIMSLYSVVLMYSLIHSCRSSMNASLGSMWDGDIFGRVTVGWGSDIFCDM